MGFSFFNTDKSRMVEAERADAGRATPIMQPGEHHVSGRPIGPPYPEGLEVAVFGMGCFWGAERVFWEAPGVWTTAVGYAGGFTPNPTYQEVCGGHTGHSEVVQVVFDPTLTSYEALLKLFWEAHDPTQGMRQGNDAGTQYRSFAGVYSDEQRAAVKRSERLFADGLKERGFGPITTEVADAPTFYFAEDYHQQYLSKNPRGYCGLKGTGVTCAIGSAAG